MGWPTDWGLRVRMIVTMILLLAVYLAVGAVIATVVVSYTGAAGIVVYGLLALGFTGVHYWYAARLLPRGLGATAVGPDEYPDLHATVERLARQADLPTSTIALVILVASGLALGGRDGGHDVPGGVVALVPVSIVVWLVGSVFVRLLARHREVAADSGAVAITANPSALAAALRSLSDELERIPDEDLRDIAELNAFFVVPVKSGFVGQFVSTHPPVDRRIERLQRLERELE